LLPLFVSLLPFLGVVTAAAAGALALLWAFGFLLEFGGKPLFVVFFHHPLFLRLLIVVFGQTWLHDGTCVGRNLCSPIAEHACKQDVWRCARLLD
jgi:hypothetical protein